MQDYWLTEAATVAAKVLDACDTPTPPLRNPKQDRCPHGFSDKGTGLCEICDSKLAARVAQKRAARLEDQRRYASAIRERRRIGA